MAFGVVVPVNLGRGAVAVTPLTTTLHAVPGATRTLLKTLDLCNTTAATINATAYIVPSAGAPAAANTLLPNVTIAGYSLFQWSGTQVLDAGDTLQLTASAAGITAHAGGGQAT